MHWLIKYKYFIRFEVASIAYILFTLLPSLILFSKNYWRKRVALNHKTICSCEFELCAVTHSCLLWLCQSYLQGKDSYKILGKKDFPIFSNSLAKLKEKKNNKGISLFILLLSWFSDSGISLQDQIILGENFASIPT